jgi:MFS family permease
MLRLAAIAAALYAGVTGFKLTLSLAALALGLSPAAIGLMLAMFSLVPILVGVRGGRMIDRIGVRRPMIGGALVVALGAAACAALPHPVVLAIATPCVGMGLMAFHLGMQHATGEIGGDARRTANFNLLTMSFSVAGILGPPLVGAAIDLSGHRAAFATTLAIAVTVLLLCRRFPFDAHLRSGSAPAGVPRGQAARPPDPDPAHNPNARPPASGAGPDGSAERDSVFSLLGAPRLRRLLVGSLLVSAAWDTFQFAMPLHGAANGLSASTVGLAVASFSAGSLGVRLVLPHLLHRMAPARWMLVAITICIAAYAALPFASSTTMLLGLACVLGIGPGIAQPLLLAALHGASPPGRTGEAAGLRMTLVGALQLALPLGLGALVTAAGTSAVFWAYAAVTATVGVLLWRERRRGR